MPGWKALSDELDPDVRAFTERLRRLVDRSGLGVGALAERTGHGHDRGAWDAYLSARRPVPRSAVAAFAEVTGVDPADLVAEWERAGGGWSRSGRPGGPDGGGGLGGLDDSRDDDDRTMQIRLVAQNPAPVSASPPSVSPPSASPPSASPPSLSPPPNPPASRRRSLLLYAVGTLGALLVVTAAILLVDLGGTDGTDDRATTTPPPTTAPTAAPSASLPAGVKCAGAGCTGRDPEAMGCGGPLAATVARTRVGAVRIEVRHSATCAAAWARITGAEPGDAVTVKVAGATRSAEVSTGSDPGSVPGDGSDPGTGAGAGVDTDAYTPMLAVAAGTDATACATLADGSEHCTAN
ncbi:DUF2690 domain-containing protein [Streptomyces sp. NPDC056169]|uniref:helix-turn-helix domain-containing protein n=1 Tax=Streptomyces sp. NPDC056169 TaxID=3345734 RepID=UPI0035D9686C